MEMKLRLLTILSLVTMGFGPVAHAATAPKYIYHLSTVMPMSIFQTGFSSPGDNDDLLPYVSGKSIKDGSASYISATDSIEVGMRVAKE